VIVVGLNLLAAFLAAISVAEPRSRPAWAFGVGTLAVASVVAAPKTLFRDLYEKAQPTADVLLYEEGRVANVVVYDFHKSGYKDLYLNAIEEASSRLWHVQLFKMLGILPVMVHDDPGKALMIAFGAGMSAGATVGHVASLDVVDLNPDVSGVAQVFAHENLGVLHHPRLRRVVNDGRNALLLDPGRYSVVISDATNPKTFDSWTLYTREFYELVKSRLEPGGVFCQWFVVPLPADSVKVLLATFRDTFPHASVWCVYGSSLCWMLATPGRSAFEHGALTKRMAPVWQPSGLAEFGIGTTDKFLSYLLLGEDELGAALRGVTRINTDDLPYVQFQVGREVEGVRAFLDLLEHQASLEPYLTHAGTGSRERLEAYRSLSRRLHLGFLLDNRSAVEEARAFAVRAGLGDDENVRSGLLYDSKRKEYFLDRVARHDGDANAHNSLGYIHWREGEHDRARRELARAVERAPSFASARANLARVHRDAGRYDEAEKEWLEVRKLNPARDVLPMVRRELDVLHLLRKLRYEPRSAPLLLALAEAHARGGAVVEAAGVARAAVEVNPRDPAALLKLASLYENLEFVEEGLATYRALGALTPGEPQVARKIAEFELLARDRSARQRWLNSNEIVFSPRAEGEGHPESCARAFRLWGEYPFEGCIDAAALARAASLFVRAVEARRDHMHAYADAARIYEALGRYGEAASLWGRGLEVAPGDRGAEDDRRRLELLASVEGSRDAGKAGVLAEIGHLYRGGGEAERAIEVLRRAVAEDPGRTGAWIELAGSYVDAGRYPEAIDAVERALALEPAAPGAPALRERLRQLKSLVGGAQASG
jgi:tetratricopeptide (TPR) repeat protein/spermidine synthase